MQKLIQTILFTSLILPLFCATSVVAADAVNYQKIYKKQCATCHGNNGDGKGRAGASFANAPTDFTSAQSAKQLTAERIKAGIRDGVSGTSMVGYGRRFDEKMLNGLTAFIQTSFMSRVSLAHEINESIRSGAGPISVSSKKPILGQKIYADNCSACHGDRGQSAVWAQSGLTPPPRNFTTAQSREELSRERMITSVTYGRPGTAMMPFSSRLSTTDIEAVVGYIRDNFMSAQVPKQTQATSNRPAPHQDELLAAVNQPHTIDVDMLAFFPEKLVGNPASGKTFYEANCFTCHGKKGDGKGPRAFFNYPRPRNFTSNESRLVFNRPRLFKSISYGKRGSVMPAWNTVLTKQQIADVAEYVFQQFILDNAVSDSEKKKH